MEKLDTTMTEATSEPAEAVPPGTIVNRSGRRILKVKMVDETDPFLLAGYKLAQYSDYDKLEKLGEGTYGVVSKVRHRPSKQIVAFKKVKLEMEEEGVPATTIREIALLKALVHKHIVRLYEFIMHNKNLYLVFEFVQMDMQQYLQLKQPIDAAIVKRMSYQLTSGIHFCHSRGVLHRDLKPQNLLVNNEGDLKIADFGLGRDHGVPMSMLTHEVVTLWYRCPEILFGTNVYGTGVDIWAIGCIVAELHIYRALFRGDSEIDQLFQIFQVFGTPTSASWPGIEDLQDHCKRFPVWKCKNLRKVVPTATSACADFIRRCLIMDPQRRFCGWQALQHPYFKDVHTGHTVCPKAFEFEDHEPMYQCMDEPG